jgi:hypothetical protein
MNWRHTLEWTGPIACATLATVVYVYLTVEFLIVHFVDFGGGDSRVAMAIPYMVPIWFIGIIYSRRALRQFRTMSLQCSQAVLLRFLAMGFPVVLLIILTVVALPLTWPVVLVYWGVQAWKLTKKSEPSPPPLPSDPRTDNPTGGDQRRGC